MLPSNPALQNADQASQIAQAALQAPINNLVILLAIIAMLIVVGTVVLIWKFAPSIIKFYQAQVEANAKLTEIVKQNASQAILATQSVDKNTNEMVKQTNAIEAQTIVISGQSLDLRNYQTLVSDNLSAHTDQIAANTANIEALKISIESLSEQIKGYLEANTNLAGVEQIIKDFRDEIIGIIQTEQAKRATGTNPITNGSQPEPQV